MKNALATMEIFPLFATNKKIKCILVRVMPVAQEQETRLNSLTVNA